MKQFELIRKWAEKKGIFSNGDVKTQYIKLQEEAGELAKAILKDDKHEIIDALGDCVIVLVNLSELCGYKLEDCVESAYNVIKHRKGKMENGTFKKNEDEI
jgi:NTP pyrophosphatase (non-canonical NTP hydrolase)